METIDFIILFSNILKLYKSLLLSKGLPDKKVVRLKTIELISTR